MTYNNPIKIKSRQETIIDQYRHLFGNSIPEDEQYWTMCNYIHHGLSLKGKELGQLLDSNLIQPQQFHGVEIKKDIYEHNLEMLDVLPINVYNGDILEVMQEEYRNGKFNPAIINLDMMWEPQVAMHELSLDVIQFLTECLTGKRIMLVLNFVAKPWCSSHKWTGTEAVNEMLKDPYFSNLLNEKIWSISNKAYEYKAQKTDMLTVLMIKEK